MKSFVLLILLPLVITGCFGSGGGGGNASSGSNIPPWGGTVQFGYSGTFFVPAAMATDSSYNSYVAGEVNTFTVESYYTSKIFLGKFNSTGTQIWAQQINPTYQVAYVGGVTVDLSGDIYVSGSSDDAPAPEQSFILKFDSSVNQVWQISEADGSLGGGISFDQSGYVYVAGATTAGAATLSKYDLSGTLHWQMQTASASGGRTTVDSSGNVYLMGLTNIGLDGNSLVGSGEDTFIKKYDSSGTWIWTRQFGNADAYGLTTDSLGNVYLTGSASIANNGGGYTEPLFLTKYDSSGNLQWTVNLGTQTTAYGITCDSNNNLYVTGDTRDTFGGEAPPALDNLFIAKYSSTGTLYWIRELDERAVTTGYAIAHDPTDGIIVSGQIFSDQLPNAVPTVGDEDGFLMKYDSLGNQE